MPQDLGRLECRICGRPIYFLTAETELKVGERLIELTCSHGHTDSYWDRETESLEAVVAPHMEFGRETAVGF